MNRSYYSRYFSMLRKKCDAFADIVGTERYENVTGTVMFFYTEFGVIVMIYLTEIPQSTTCDGDTTTEYRIKIDDDELLPLICCDNTVFSAFLTKFGNVEEMPDKRLAITVFDADNQTVAYGDIRKSNHNRS